MIPSDDDRPVSLDDALRDGWDVDGLDSARAARDAAVSAGNAASPSFITLADGDAGPITRASTGAVSGLPPALPSVQTITSDRKEPPR